MRHAPSADAASAAAATTATTATTRDHDRPITEAGVAAAKACARALLAAGWLPDLVVASDALRSRQTLQAMGEEVPALREVRVRFAGSLYAAAAMDDNQTARALAATLDEALSDGEGGGAMATAAAATATRGEEEEEQRRRGRGRRGVGVGRVGRVRSGCHRRRWSCSAESGNSSSNSRRWRSSSSRSVRRHRGCSLSLSLSAFSRGEMRSRRREEVKEARASSLLFFLLWLSFFLCASASGREARASTSEQPFVTFEVFLSSFAFRFRFLHLLRDHDALLPPLCGDDGDNVDGGIPLVAEQQQLQPEQQQQQAEDGSFVEGDADLDERRRSPSLSLLSRRRSHAKSRPNFHPGAGRRQRCARCRGRRVSPRKPTGRK